MERSSDVHSGGMRGHSGPRDRKGRAALCQSGSGTAVSNKTEVCDFLSQKPLWVACVRTLASSVPSCPARAHSVKISCDPHLSENTTRVICDFFESNTTDIDQRISPTVMQTSANVRLRSALMPFPVACRVSNESARRDLGTEGIIEHSHLSPRTPELRERRHNCRVSLRRNCRVRQAGRS